MLFTLGYEGIDLKQFLDCLRNAKVTIVLDVRELPLSRKKGFSKRALQSALADVGILYRHMPALGCPKPIRNSYKQSGDWAQYTRDFKRHLKSQRLAVDEVAAFNEKAKACLVCFEADPLFCHRSIVAQAATGDRVMHLKPREARAGVQTPVAA
jgi:uncharacterized protein (DUF488 family)